LTRDGETFQRRLINRRWPIANLLCFAALINYVDRTIVSVAPPAHRNVHPFREIGDRWLISHL